MTPFTRPRAVARFTLKAAAFIAVAVLLALAGAAQAANAPVQPLPGRAQGFADRCIGGA